MRTLWSVLVLGSLASACTFSAVETDHDVESEPDADAPDAGGDEADAGVLDGATGVDAGGDAMRAVDGGTCVAALERCRLFGTFGTTCCEGYCDETGYGFGSCMPKKPDGAVCSSARSCESAHCEEGVCGGPAECTAEGSPCGFGAGCCGDSECRFLSYGVSTCVVPLADGEACVYSAECATHRCAAGLCRSAECVEPAERCNTDHECCRGVCAGGVRDGTYGWGRCVEPLEAGAACIRDAWCLSRSCVDGLCE